MVNLESLARSIAEKTKGKDVLVALSGGLDSSLVLYLVGQYGQGRSVLPLHIDWGQYRYNGVLKKVEQVSRMVGMVPQYLNGEKALEGVLRSGPACNRCTRQAKIALLKEHYPGYLILTGANQSDSWGKRGMPELNGIYAPLFDLTKDEIRSLASLFKLPIENIGESNTREGCKAKHLLKPLISSEFHGRVVCQANEALLSYLRKKGKRMQLANVKIVGPLGENFALVNTSPSISQEEKEELKGELVKVEGISRIGFVDSPLRLIIVSNPAIYYDSHSRNSILEGILSPSFSAELSSIWLLSKNKRLLSFQIVDYEFSKGMRYI